MRYIIKEKERGTIICENAQVAKSFKERLIGLMFSRSMKGFDGLLIEPCQSIHTFFMNYTIDVVFLNKENKVVKIIKNMKPWRMSGYYFSAWRVLELKGGSLNMVIEKNQELEFKCIS